MTPVFAAAPFGVIAITLQGACRSAIAFVVFFLAVIRGGLVRFFEVVEVLAVESVVVDCVDTGVPLKLLCLQWLSH